MKRWLRICSRMAAKFTNSSEESSMGSAVYFSSSVFTENLQGSSTGGGDRHRAPRAQHQHLELSTRHPESNTQHPALNTST